MENLVRNLANMNGRVYVYLDSEEVGNAFLKQAESEGFKYKDGSTPTSKPYEQVMAVNSNGTINYIGTNGMIAFYANAGRIGLKKLIRVDYQKYAAGEKNFKYRKRPE